MHRKIPPMADVAAWYLAQPRRPSIAEVAAEYGVARSTAHRHIVAAHDAGLIARRTKEELWGR